MSEHDPNNESRYFDAMKNEKDQRISELNQYNIRLDRTILLYISAVYAAIGLNATNKIDLGSLRSGPDYVLLSYLFIFLNACIIIHGISQSCWSMSLAKFIHVKINKEILKKLGFPSDTDSDDKKDLKDISILGWDNWRTDIKGLANETRGVVMGLWIILVLGSSVYSLYLVNISLYINKHLIASFFIEILLIALHIYAVYLFLFEMKYIEHWHDLEFSLECKTKRMLLSTASWIVLSAVIIISLNI